MMDVRVNIKQLEEEQEGERGIVSRIRLGFELLLKLGLGCGSIP